MIGERVDEIGERKVVLRGQHKNSSESNYKFMKTNMLPLYCKLHLGCRYFPFLVARNENVDDQDKLSQNIMLI